MTLVIILFQWLLVLALSPLTVGMVRKTKARFQNRRGASVFLPYFQLLSLLRKEMTITRHSSWVFRTVPFVVLGSAMFLALVAPAIFLGVIPPSIDNIFLIGAILALGSVFLVLGGMDTASTFGNMGSSREMTLAGLVEPALYLSLASLGLAAGAWNLGGIVGYFASTPWVVAVAPAFVSIIALFFVTLAENARYPVDNPATHLELTMVHEAMILEYSGPYLAMLEYASAIKLSVMTAFVMHLILPFGFVGAPLTLSGIALGIVVYICMLTLGAGIIASIESTIVKMRFYRMQEYMSIAFFVACAGLIVELFTSYR